MLESFLFFIKGESGKKTPRFLLIYNILIPKNVNHQSFLVFDDVMPYGM